jgi:hypothetical protein
VGPRHHGGTPETSRGVGGLSGAGDPLVVSARTSAHGADQAAPDEDEASRQPPQ